MHGIFTRSMQFAPMIVTGYTHEVVAIEFADDSIVLVDNGIGSILYFMKQSY